MTAKETLKSKVLKNKNWTGREVARALVLDLVANYENLVNGQNKHVLTDEDKQTLVDNLTRPEDIKIYNQFKPVHDFLTGFPLMYTHAEMDLSLQLEKLAFLSFQVYLAETDQHFRIMESPVIVTQEKYDQLVKADREEKLAQTYSVEMLFMETLAYFQGQLVYARNPKKVPAITKALKAMGDKQVTNKRLLKIWTEDWDQKEPLTERKVLEEITGFYESMETDSNKTFIELAKDFPALYNAVMDYILSFKELAFIKNIPKSKYVTNDKAVALSLLYEIDFCGTRQYVDIFDPTILEPKDGQRYNAGVAVLKAKGWRTPEDDNGVIRGPYNPVWTALNTEKILLDPKVQETVKWRLERAGHDIVNLYAQHILMDRTKDLLDLPQLDILINPIETMEDRVAKLNDSMNTAANCITALVPNRDADQITAEVKELLVPIDLEVLKARANEYMGSLKITLETFRYDVYGWAANLYAYTAKFNGKGRKE